MTPASPERRRHPRLRLRYPIRLDEPQGEDAATLGRTVTQDLSARGAYVQTFHPEPYTVGSAVAVTVTVPHQLAAGGEPVQLDMRALGTIVRIDGPRTHGLYGEDGLAIAGVAIEFEGPLSFEYRWV